MSWATSRTPDLSGLSVPFPELRSRSCNTLRAADATIEWRGWYSLRRGIAATLHSIEKDPMAAKGLLRHSSVLTTQMHYIKEAP